MWCDYVKAGDVLDAITAVAVILGVFVAWKGLQTWREQLKGTSEYQLAKDTLKAAYRVQATFRLVRQRIPIDSSKDDCDDKYKEICKRLLVEVTSAYSILNERGMESQVEWGTSFISVQERLISCFKKYSYECEVAQYEGAPFVGDDTTAVIKGSNDRDGKDSFADEIDSGVADFEKFLRPIIDKKSASFFKRLCRPFRAWKKKKD